MSTTQKIFDVLAQAAAPLSKQEILDCMPDGTEPDLIGALLSQRCKAGELERCIEDGIVKWQIAPGIDPAARKSVKRTPAETKQHASNTGQTKKVTSGPSADTPKPSRGKDAEALPIDIGVHSLMRDAIMADAPRPVLLGIVALQDAVNAWRAGHG